MAFARATTLMASRLSLQSIPEPNSGCHLWTGAIRPDGYGALGLGKKYILAHRAAVLVSGRPIPEGLVVDHMCRTRSCVNPDHLRVVTRRENALENSDSAAAKHARQTECSRCGGPFDKVNNRGQRFCSKCANAITLAHYRKMRDVPGYMERRRECARENARKRRARGSR